jgi:hypothetical protein
LSLGLPDLAMQTGLPRNRQLKIRSLAKEMPDFFFKGEGGVVWGESLHRVPVLINEEFGKVPLDVIGDSASKNGVQVIKQRCGVASIDINLFKDFKFHTVPLVNVGGKLSLVGGYLSTKLIGREPKNN